MESTSKLKYGGLRVAVFSVTMVVTIAVCVILLADPNASQIMLNVIYAFITDKIGWSFSLFGLASLIFLIWLACSRYGKIRLGSPGDKPEYSTFSWIAMLFCTGQGSTLILWSILEPIQYSAGPPFNLAQGSLEAMEYAAAYGAFHWGPSAWALMVLPAVPLAYYYLVRRNPHLSMASPFEGRYSQKVCSIIDVLVLFTCIANACTSLGLASPTIGALITYNYGLPASAWLNIAVLLVFIAIFSTSAGLGLDKGIQKLSKINIHLVYGLFAFVMIIGPTSFILNTFTNDLSIFFNEYLRMSLYTDPFGRSAWPQNWTIFYWAWWVTACPYTAIFIAKISKGRTIREVAIGGFLWGTLGDFVAFAVLGGSTMYAQVFQGMDLTSIMNSAGNSAAVAALISSFPFAIVLVPLFIASMFIFSSTTYDSCTYVMANVAFKSSSVNDEAPRWQRLLWAALVAIAASTLLYLGGLKPLQSFSIITAIPMGIISIAICVLFIRDIRKDYKAVFGESHETYLDLDNQKESASTAPMDSNPV